MKWLLFLWGFVAPLLGLSCCEKLFSTPGENITLAVQCPQMSEIILKKDKHKVAEWEWPDQETYFPPLGSRVSINKENRSLTVSNLEKTDSGEYVLECVDPEGRSYHSTTVLTVVDPPPEPEISCNITDNINLSCTTDFHLPVNYTWTVGSETLPRQDQEISIPKNHPPSTRVMCAIKFLQIEKTTQIWLDQCLQADEGARSPDLTALYVVVALLAVVGVSVLLHKRGYRPPCLKRPRKPNPNRGSADLEADHGVSNGDIPEKSSILLHTGGDGCGVNGGVTQGAGDVNEKCLKSSDPH